MLRTYWQIQKVVIITPKKLLISIFHVKKSSSILRKLKNKLMQLKRGVISMRKELLKIVLHRIITPRSKIKHLLFWIIRMMLTKSLIIKMAFVLIFISHFATVDTKKKTSIILKGLLNHPIFIGEILVLPNAKVIVDGLHHGWLRSLLVFFAYW